MCGLWERAGAGGVLAECGNGCGGRARGGRQEGGTQPGIAPLPPVSLHACEKGQGETLTREKNRAWQVGRGDIMGKKPGHVSPLFRRKQAGGMGPLGETEPAVGF